MIKFRKVFIFGILGGIVLTILFSIFALMGLYLVVDWTRYVPLYLTESIIGTGHFSYLILLFSFLQNIIISIIIVFIVYMIMQRGKK
jgi:hypothetical protein